ncbi:iron complex transport system substrate-binding protein [Desulfotomaculum arcticum]|uniref:Iron complex transport system substrate-binding protein n=1 Tax=Desulfotruncus arcticus DSM 17038 TaxID=1121424 RepID=A0A1I2R1T9_9FIRM|nr:ABC transporter substrate-binding protein [Desulfotruncus arcticus]SFG34644.1 iron complex transport system substrate-binding protein [Desulfotomaculum arcticum] [Desulfotruncus arcticus DSM 17038]
MRKTVKTSVALAFIVALLISLAGCGSSITAGGFTGAAAGYHGDLEVTTEVDQDGKITGITVCENNETEDIGSVAIEKIPQRIIEAQSLDVDVVSGATLTSNGIINAVADSLRTAGADPAKYGYVSPPEEEVVATAINKDAMPVKQEITDSVTITDAKGRKVTIDLPISSYAISTMDVVDYIIPLKGKDAFNMLVASGQDGGGGIQKYGKLYTPAVGNYLEHLGQISDHNAPFDLEMILAMDPDVLIVNSAMSAHNYALEIEDQLTRVGIPIVLINVPGKNLDKSVQQTMKLLGQIFQEEEKAAAVSAFIDEQYGLIASKKLAKREDKPAVYYEKSGYSEIYGSTATSVTGWGLPISIAGGENIADALLLDTAASGGGGNTLDPEYVIKADPDYIILSGVNDGWLDSVKETKKCEFDIFNRIGWRDLAAVKNGHLYEFAHATSRSIYAFYPCLKMAKIFYPEEFKEVDPEAVLDEFFERFMLLDSDISTWFISPEDVQASK